jgi:aminoglycoside phosphotransferase (APT) family kinase protein
VVTSREEGHQEVRRLLRQATGVEVSVVATDELAHARGSVERVTLGAWVEGVGRTVIVKRRDPDSEVGAFAQANLSTERTALELLHEAGADVAPRLIAGGDEDGVIVMTDVGQVTVESVLFADDADAARAALVALAATTARLHRAPRDSKKFDGTGTWTIATRDSQWHLVRDALTDLGLPALTSDVEEEHRVLVAEFRSPGGLVAMTHGDLTPNNAIIDDLGQCRLVDFEGAGYQHLGIDASMLRFPFAWYGKWALVPGDVQRAMERAYRDALGAPSVAVDRAIAVGCLAMTLLRLERLPRIATADQTPETALRRRVQMVSTIEVGVDAARNVDAFPELTRWLADVVDAMRDRWSEAREAPPLYPAFRG